MDNHELDQIQIWHNTVNSKLDKVLELLYTKGDYKTGTIPEPELDPGLQHTLEQVLTED